ncbi:MAG: hypothetical protein D8M56_18875 [Chloroflexi bacterium]|nr:hypothetical protein [Chloroflexota bacterium]
MTSVATATRIANVAVGVGEGVIVAVAVGEAVNTTVGDGSIVEVTVAEADGTSISGLGCLSVFSLNSRYTKLEPLAAKSTIMPMMTDHFFKPNLIPLGHLWIISTSLQHEIVRACSISGQRQCFAGASY